MTDVPPRARVPILALGFLALVLGVFAGLARLGLAVDDRAAVLAAYHGPLMIAGFFGVVISLERAVAAARIWAYSAPLACGLAAVALFAGEPAVAAALATFGAAVLAYASLRFVAMQPELHTATIAAGAVALVAGNLVWYASGNPAAAVPAWAAFLVLTIAGERLELTRFLPRSTPARNAFVAIALAIAAGSVLAADPRGARAFGAAMLALAAWLAVNDLARRTVRDTGLTRYTAVCLLSGYVWLAVAGATIAAAGLVPGTASYDAALHALFVGFVFAMVFGHAPIIFPAVLRVKVPYGPSFYLPLALLHASVAIRLAGDATGFWPVLQAGGIANAVALGAFIATAVASVMRGRRTPPAAPPPRVRT
ncbi:hypothetical protein BURK1_02602 [Burkholderiales bacterium]|nr:hypothetical protein BURK1_02602 [Burkholderiales bacterium]